MNGARLVAWGLAAVLVAAPATGEAKGSGKRARAEKGKLTGVVNLNTATVAQLDLLPGIGEVAAKKIVAYRQTTPFRRIEDLVKVKGFGKKRFEKLRPFLAVTGETSLKLQKPGRPQARASPPAR